MFTQIRTARQLRSRRVGALALVAVTALLAGCGTSSPRPTATTGASSRSKAISSTSTTNRSAAGSARHTVAATPQNHSPGARTPNPHGPGSPPAAAFAFARCMRSNGVTNLADPKAGQGLGITPAESSSPAFHTAFSRCQKLLPIGPGGGEPPSRQTMARLLRIARCMRAHGIHQFPDPLYSRPRQFAPGKYQEITDFDGATLLFPADMDLQAPAYRQALAACGAPPLGLPH